MRSKAIGVRGFTLIEMLIVMVLIAILAAIAIPQLFGTKERTFVSSMRSDLRNLETAQEAYYVDHLAYSASVAALGVSYLVSPGVSVTIDSASQTGWGATVTHASTPITCSIVVTRSYTGTPTCP